MSLSIPSSSVSPKIMLTPPTPPRPAAITDEKVSADEKKKSNHLVLRAATMVFSAGLISLAGSAIKDPSLSTVEKIGPACSIAVGSFFFGLSILPWSSKKVK